MDDTLVKYTDSTILDLAPLVRKVAHLPLKNSLAKTQKKNAIQGQLDHVDDDIYSILGMKNYTPILE